MAAAAVCGVLGWRTLGRGAISATSAHGLGRGKAREGRGKRRRRQVHKRGRRRTTRRAFVCVGTCGKGATSATCVYVDPPSHCRSLSVACIVCAFL